MNDKNKGRVVLVVVALSSMTLGALGTAYALGWKSIKPNFTLTVNSTATTMKWSTSKGNRLERSTIGRRTQ